MVARQSPPPISEIEHSLICSDCEGTVNGTNEVRSLGMSEIEGSGQIKLGKPAKIFDHDDERAAVQAADRNVGFDILPRQVCYTNRRKE